MFYYCTSQKHPIIFQRQCGQSCSQAEGRAETVNEADQKGQNSLHIYVQSRHGHSWTYGTKSLILSFRMECRPSRKGNYLTVLMFF